MRGVPGRSAGERGAVTAETVMILPVLVAFAVGLVWALSLGVAQVRTVDAARETARALARGEPSAVATDLGRKVAPAGAQVRIVENGDLVRVRVHAWVEGPAGLLGALPSPTLRAEATARSEDAGSG